MSTIRNIRLKIDREDVLRRSGFGGNSNVRPGMQNRITDLLGEVEKMHLLKPAACYEIYSAREIKHLQLFQKDDKAAVDYVLNPIISKVEFFAVIIETIGHHLESEATRCMQAGEQWRGLIMDSIGTAAIDALTRDVLQVLRNESSLKGFGLSRSIMPGLAGYSLSKQSQLMELAGAPAIGVNLTSSGVMIPRKSISMIIGIGRHMSSIKPFDNCKDCNLGRMCKQKSRTLTGSCQMESKLGCN